MKRLAKKFTRSLLLEERGSISVLIIGLFVLTVGLMMVMTDISSLVLSRKALTRQTEFLVQQGAKEIDLGAYYQGTGNLATYVAEKLFIDQKDSGIPLNCEQSRAAILEVSRSIENERLRNFELLSMECQSGLLAVETQAEAVIPFRLPFLDSMNFTIKGFAANSPERRNGFWLRGLRLW